MGEKTLDEARFLQSGTALNRVLEEAPYLSRCSDNKTAGLVRPREYALKYPYMQVNRPGMVSWLVFDLDHSNPLVWEDEGLPAPNIVVTNRKNGHAHLFYAIPPVCTSENARPKPIAYMKAVYEAMATKLGADESYSGPVAKTPGHPWWSTWEIHPTVYELGELADYLDLSVKPRWSLEPNLDEVAHSRHCTLFEELRFYAYSIVNREREEGTYQGFYSLLENYASSKNNFSQRGFSNDLTWSQVKATVKSVARWTWDRYTGSSKCQRGVMGLDKSLPLKERQRKAAERTHSCRRKATELKIITAHKQLIAQGAKVTQAAVAAHTGLTRQTVAKHKHLITTPSTLNVVPMPQAQEGDLSPVSDVKYSLDQISALQVVDKCEWTVLEFPKKEISNISFNDVSLHAEKGANGAKSLFSQICSTLSSIPRVEGVVCPFSFEFRGRMARVVVSYGLSELDSVLVAISVASSAADPAKLHFSQDDWMGYLVRALQNARAAKLELFDPLVDKFKTLLNGGDAYLTDYQWGLFRDYRNMCLQE